MSSKKPLSARGSPRVKGSGKKKKKKSSPRQTNSLEAKKASPSVSLPTEPSDVLEWKRSLHRFKWALEEEKESPNGHIKAPRVPATFSEVRPVHRDCTAPMTSSWLCCPCPDVP